MNKIIVSIIIFIFLTNYICADELWSSWRKIDPVIHSIAFEDDIIWCSTSDGVLKYDKKTGYVTGYTTDDGLRNNMVNCVVVDNYGNKWFGNMWGVSKFDGITWESSSLIAEFSDIANGGNSILWAATTKGIRKYVDGEWEKMTDEDYSCLTVDNNGVVWAGSTTPMSNKNYILRIEDSNETMIGTENNAVNYQPVRDITFDPNTGLIWIAVHTGFISYDDIEQKLTEYYCQEPDVKSYNVIAVDGDGTVWLGNDNGLSRFKGGELTVFTVDDGLIDNGVCSLAIDSDGILWIGTETGLCSFNGEEFVTHMKNDLYSNNIASIVIDNENTVWCSHTSYIQADPLSYFKNEKWNIGLDGISKLFGVDENGTLWGSSYGALCNYDGELRIIYLYYTGVSDEYGIAQPYDLYIDENIIWVVSSESYSTSVSGFWWFDKNDIETYYDESRGYYRIPANNIFFGDSHALSVDSKHNFWIGTNGDGLYKYDGVKITQYTKINGLSGNSIRYIEVDNNDIVWFSVFHDAGDDDYHSLVSYDGATFTDYTAENSDIPRLLIYSLFVDHNNTKWIGTDAGACRFDGETWTTFNTQNSGLCDNKVNAIAVEENNTIWFGTDDGVSRYTGEIITTSVDEENQTPETLPLITTYPNPFNPSTTIEFTLPEPGFATISIYSMAGQKIRELTADFLPAGTHTLSWDGRDTNGNAVSSGIYITRLQAGKHTATGRMVLVR